MEDFGEIAKTLYNLLKKSDSKSQFMLSPTVTSWEVVHQAALEKFIAAIVVYGWWVSEQYRKNLT